MNVKNAIIEEYRQKDFVGTFDRTRAEEIFRQRKHEFETEIIKNIIRTVRKEKVNVLDVACGTGRILSEIINNPRVVYTGLDTSKEMVARLKAKHQKSKINLVLADASKMPFEDETFDVTFTYHLLWHLPVEEQKKIILEMIRVTKKGGCVLFDALNKHFLWEDIKKITGAKIDSGMYRLDVQTVRKIIGERKFKVHKLIDPPIKNSVIFGTIDLLNKIGNILPSRLFHMLFFQVKV